MEEIWTSIIEKGHQGSTNLIGAEKSDLSEYCADAPYWKEWSYLSNGNNELCTKGLAVGFDLATSSCSKNVAINVNGIGADCKIGERSG